jgi:hypothetical protein
LHRLELGVMVRGLEVACLLNGVLSVKLQLLLVEGKVSVHELKLCLMLCGHGFTQKRSKRLQYLRRDEERIGKHNSLHGDPK